MKEIIIDGSHEYDLDCSTLYYSQEEFWSHPGEEVMTLTDTGNELRFSNNKLEYDEALELYILLSAHFKSEGRKIEIVTQKEEL